MDVIRALRWGRLVGLLALAMGFSAPPPAVLAQAKTAAKPADKVTDIRRLIELSGSPAAGVQALREMVGMMRVVMPSAPSGYWEEFVREARPAELAELLVPVIDHHLTHEEVKAAIAFYESPAGRKMAGVTPAITREAMQVGLVWGGQTGQRVRSRLRR